MKITVLGLSITSSWGNGHATTYRALVRGLAARGHDVLFLERNAEWYADNRDLPSPPYCRTRIYDTIADLSAKYVDDIATSDLVIVGSYVPEGVAVGDLVFAHAQGVTAFYDIDTPVTLAKIETGIDYLAPRQIGRYDLYLSFTGGPILDVLRERYDARYPVPLYCSVDPEQYRPDPTVEQVFDLGYLGTYSDDRQPVLDTLMLRAARRWRQGRFAVAGPQYPATIEWPANVRRTLHLSPAHHRLFYNQLRYTLNVTRRDMVEAGYSPSVRLFEAAACGTPIISDEWKGIGSFFAPASEILLSSNARQTLTYLREIPEEDRLDIGRRARARVLAAHTSEQRALELEGYVGEVTSPSDESREGSRIDGAPAIFDWTAS
jgi:spore maturation protein CgeB